MHKFIYLELTSTLNRLGRGDVRLSKLNIVSWMPYIVHSAGRVQCRWVHCNHLLHQLSGTLPNTCALMTLGQVVDTAQFRESRSCLWAPTP